MLIQLGAVNKESLILFKHLCEILMKEGSIYSYTNSKFALFRLIIKSEMFLFFKFCFTKSSGTNL